MVVVVVVGAAAAPGDSSSQCSGSTGSICFFGLPDLDPDPLVRGMDPDPDPSFIKRK